MMHAAGLLKLSEKEARAYRLALAKYGWSSSAAFLRACGMALMAQDKANDVLVAPLRFSRSAKSK